MAKAKDIGIDVPAPPGECEDPHCPFHGHLRVRGQLFEGEVVSTRMEGTVTVRRDYLHLVPKFERYEKRSSRIKAHRPPCLPIRAGDRVLVGECRPLSKTVSFVVVGTQEGPA